MPGPMPTFRRIHGLRVLLHTLQEQTDRVPRLRKAHAARLAKQEQSLRETQDALRKLKVSASDDEKSLKAKHGQIARYEEQISLVSAKKEYDALQLEIAHARTVCGHLEDDALRKLTEADEKAALIPELEKTLAQIRDEVAKFDAEAGPRLADLAAQAADAKARLAAAEAEIPKDLLPQYARTIASLKHEGMAAVKGGACSACYTDLIRTDVLALEDERFVVCNSCGRILYLPESSRRPEPAEE